MFLQSSLHLKPESWFDGVRLPNQQARKLVVMRILLTHHLPLEGTASGRLTRDLATGLMEAGHEVSCLVVEGRTKSAPANFGIERITCRPGSPQADLAFDLPGFGPSTRLSFADLSDDRLVEYRNALRRKLDRSIERFNPHVVHCQHAWLFAHLALESGAPYVIGAFGAELAEMRDEPRYRRLAEQAIENASCVIVHSRFQADEVGRLFPECAGRIQLAPPPIAVDRTIDGTLREVVLSMLSIRTDLPVIVCFGDLTPTSDASTLINAQAALAARGVAVSLVLCGDGPQRAELETQARHQHLADVHFVGELPADQGRSLMQAADLCIAASCEAESQYTAINSLLCGTPVIEADCGAAAEIIDEHSGGLVAANDHERLAEAIEQALAQSWKARKGPQARQSATARYSLRDSIARHVAIYQTALIQRYGSAELP